MCHLCSTYRELLGAGHSSEVKHWFLMPGALEKTSSKLPTFYFPFIALESVYSSHIYITYCIIYSGIGETETSLNVVSTKNYICQLNIRLI